MTKLINKIPFNAGDKTSVTITDLNHDGEGVGKAEGFTLFVPGSLPGEEAAVKIDLLKKGFGRARLEAILKTSSSRTTPFCPYFSRCGGCQLQHMNYRDQLSWKQKRVADTLERIGGFSVPVKPVIGMKHPLSFRNKADIHAGIDKGNITLGFYASQSRQLTDIKECPVQHPMNNKFLNLIRSYIQSDAEKFRWQSENEIPVSGLVLRSSFSSNKCMVTFKTGKNRSAHQLCTRYARLLSSEAKSELAGVVMLQDSDNKTTLLSGKTYLEENIGTFRYRISPLSFFQVNPSQAGKLYDEAASHLKNTDRVFDLYCGTGTLSLYLSRSAKSITAIESLEAAVKDARENAAINFIKNIDFIHARVEDAPHLISESSTPFTVFMNPPRGGSSPELLNLLGQSRSERIVYISCNPATLARDLKLLAGHGYLLSSIQPVDMFPHTSHVETVVLMSRVDK